MSDIILGVMCRKNFGLRSNYLSTLRSEFKSYIDLLYRDIIGVVYGTNRDNCIVTRVYSLLLTQEEIDSCLGDIKYKELEDALIYFCKLHDVFLSIKRLDNELEIIIDLLVKFDVQYI